MLPQGLLGKDELHGNLGGTRLASSPVPLNTGPVVDPLTCISVSHTGVNTFGSPEFGFFSVAAWGGGGVTIPRMMSYSCHQGTWAGW